MAELGCVRSKSAFRYHTMNTAYPPLWERSVVPVWCGRSQTVGRHGKDILEQQDV